MDISEHLAWFDNFAAQKIDAASSDSSPLRLKLLHTHNVLANAHEIARAEAFPLPLARATGLAALYHDLSRFDQYLVYKTFKDAVSRNHGAWSIQLLKQHKLLEKEPLRFIIQAAVCFHNRRVLPSNLPVDFLKAAQVVRDADKLDIMRVMDEHLAKPGPYNPTVILSLPDDPNLFSPRVIACASSCRCASYGDLTSVNDFRLLLGSWFYDMNFASSRKLLKRAGHAKRLIEMLPENGPYSQARAALLTELTE